MRRSLGLGSLLVLVGASIGIVAGGGYARAAQEGHGGHGGGAPSATPAAGTPYADPYDPTAAIRSLTAEELAQVERGEGAGFALPAELNGVPGPRHVLDVADELALSGQQVTEVRAVADEMRVAVIPAGNRYLEALQALEEDFRSGTLTAGELPGRVAEVARLEGELATAHLVAHLETAELLTPEQIEAYNRLRGYR